MKTDIFIPCFVDQLYPQTAFNLVKLLEIAGCDVQYNSNQTCCGQPAFNAGFCNDSLVVAKKFLADFRDAEYIIVPSASCAGFIRNYMPGLFSSAGEKEEVLALAKKTFEFSEFLVNVLNYTDFGAALPAKATYHDSCAALRECGIKAAPRTLMANVKGLELMEMNDVETCCGFGGTFSVKFEPISNAMAEQKLENILATGADVVISTDLSCLMQIGGLIRKRKLNLTVMHLADVLATGIK